MLTAGVDLASRPERTGSCVVDWSGNRAVVAELAVGVTDGDILELAGGVSKLGIDVPLGWPAAFVDAVHGHARDGSWPAGYRHGDEAYRLRRTDVWVWRHVGGSPPLSVATDRIALPAMRAASLLSRLPERPPVDGTGLVVEAYPAAALRRWGLPWRGYKGKANAGARAGLVAAFLERTSPWLRIGAGHEARCRQRDDAFDALVAALIARAAAAGLVEDIPDADRAAAGREGWMAIPTVGSLEQLVAARPA